MRELITIFIIAGSILITQNVFAQTANITEKQSIPSATVTFDSPRTVSPMVTKVNDLTDGDDVLTEMVIAEIYATKDIMIKDVVSDNDFDLMSENEKAICISESEVIQIIDRLKL